MFRKRLAGSAPVLMLVGVVSMVLAGPALAAEPTILSESVSSLTATDATLNAVIEDKAAPNGALYQFQLVANPSEYQTTFDCPPQWEHSSVCLKMPERGEHSGTLPYGITKAGLAEAPVSEDVAKARDFGNLTPNTTYHYRVIAASDVLEEDFINWEPPVVFGPDQTFTTPAAPPLPRWFINGLKAGATHEPGISFGKITLSSAALPNLECESYAAFSFWNAQPAEGTERGLEETTGYGTFECKNASPCEVTNERGIKKEGIFATAEQPPEVHSEKAYHNGNTSLPWNGELTEKEVRAGSTEKFVLTHHLKLWEVIPLGTEMGGTGVGAGCAFGGHEISFQETEKPAGEEFEARWLNGAKNGLTPSKVVYESGGHLVSEFGAGFLGGSVFAAGANFGLVLAK